MAKRVFFSFHYEDVKTFRVNVVRQHDLTKETGEAGFFDASIWEDAELHGDYAVKNLINRSLNNTTVTCVLIGTNTWSRRWVKYEILKSYERGNVLIGIYINSIPDKYRQIFIQGANPFSYLGFFIDKVGHLNYYQEHNGMKWSKYQDLVATSKNFDQKYWNRSYQLSEWITCYDWMKDDGYNNFANWIEEAK
ncbi:hypothetical protein COX93_02835 [Candidatus Nomurabacteria bacterium CG_4_10_14_0_2_um_filter_30_12]|uniref:Thoeris protein ThsB TIR-like domain-containing protein n=1 Tax=Candidatus Nomurabacteria bacterium CG_4_10_14_0_2_um_filter_30_12 TaxID=1974727 RepID=A0A2J0MF60_9BACT|nr:MAG: hypothetical protein COX93_02835 [Candidatus Nomurabacteria bacterium CG_4_10_14_0_2_um_filter_30_12]